MDILDIFLDILLKPPQPFMGLFLVLSMEGRIDRFFMHLSISHTRATHPFHPYIASTPSVKVNFWGMFPYSCSTEA